MDDETTGTQSLQERYAPESRCFGCGPQNDQGLHIRSFADGQECIADFIPAVQHEAFPGMLNGGIIGALLDCHSNWTAAVHLMNGAGRDTPPCTVTAEFHVKLRRPTPTGGPVRLRAHVVESSAARATVEATLEADGVITSTCRGVFVAVKEGHPAFGRW